MSRYRSSINPAEGMGHLAVITAVGASAYIGLGGLITGMLIFIGWVFYNDRRPKR